MPLQPAVAQERKRVCVTTGGDTRRHPAWTTTMQHWSSETRRSVLRAKSRSIRPLRYAESRGHAIARDRRCARFVSYRFKTEKRQPSKPCCAQQVRHYRGACIKLDSLNGHNHRLHINFAQIYRIQSPFDDPIVFYKGAVLHVLTE